MGNYGKLLLTARSADAVSDVSLEEIASSSTCGFAVRNSGERRSRLGRRLGGFNYHHLRAAKLLLQTPSVIRAFGIMSNCAVGTGGNFVFSLNCVILILTYNYAVNN